MGSSSEAKPSPISPPSGQPCSNDLAAQLTIIDCKSKSLKHKARLFDTTAVACFGPANVGGSLRPARSFVQTVNHPAPPTPSQAATRFRFQ
jgi:hypothetical protein